VGTVCIASTGGFVCVHLWAQRVAFRNCRICWTSTPDGDIRAFNSTIAAAKPWQALEGRSRRRRPSSVTCLAPGHRGRHMSVALWYKALDVSVLPPTRDDSLSSYHIPRLSKTSEQYHIITPVCKDNQPLLLKSDTTPHISCLPHHYQPSPPSGLTFPPQCSTTPPSSQP
jgi:hypothetical protein